MLPQGCMGGLGHVGEATQEDLTGLAKFASIASMRSEIDWVIANHFGGSTAKACEALGVTRAAISQWRKAGIPKLRKHQIENTIRSLADHPMTGIQAS